LPWAAAPPDWARPSTPSLPDAPRRVGGWRRRGGARRGDRRSRCHQQAWGRARAPSLCREESAPTPPGGLMSTGDVGDHGGIRRRWRHRPAAGDRDRLVVSADDGRRRQGRRPARGVRSRSPQDTACEPTWMVVPGAATSVASSFFSSRVRSMCLASRRAKSLLRFASAVGRVSSTSRTGFSPLNSAPRRTTAARGPPGRQAWQCGPRTLHPPPR
jgi:hypothetical protein